MQSNTLTCFAEKRWRGFRIASTTGASCGPSEGVQSLPAVQDRPVLLRRVSETGLDNGRPQGNVRQSCIQVMSSLTHEHAQRGVGRADM